MLERANFEQFDSLPLNHLKIIVALIF